MTEKHALQVHIVGSGAAAHAYRTEQQANARKESA